MSNGNRPGAGRERDLEAEVQQRQEEFRRAEEALRGMSSRDFGTAQAEFEEPVRLREPVNPEYPEDIELLELASSLALVSADPSIATPIVREEQGPQGEATEVQESFNEFDKPPEVDITAPGEPSLVSMAPESPAMPPLDSFQVDASRDVALAVPAEPVGGPPEEPPKSPAADMPLDEGPGFGLPIPQQPDQPATLRGAEEVAQRFQERLQPQVAVAADETLAPTPPEPTSDRPADRQQRTPRQEATRPPEAPSTPPMERMVGAGPRTTAPLQDYGLGGDSTAYQEPTQQSLGIIQEAVAAVDAIGHRDEEIMVLLRRLTMMVQRHGEELAQLNDLMDSEDEADEF